MERLGQQPCVTKLSLLRLIVQGFGRYIQMLSIGSGVERSKREWTELLQTAGLEIRGIWSGGSVMESVIEAVPILIQAWAI
ncbi:hypothetical protein BDW59DRAFT_154811 [Aspergillus cavernicola]|uniref:Uncharacterized protein n=1 Tax=Aspergillus cavernicola TaxID=176166 RepID=A0ABR4HDV0_9EURO